MPLSAPEKAGVAGLAFAGGALLLRRAMAPGARDLRGRVVLVTGGGGGVGREAAIAFAQQGARVLLWDLFPAALDDSAAAIRAAVPGADVRTTVVDLCDREAVYAAADAAQRQRWGGGQREGEGEREGGGVFCVVNNAGIVTGAPLLEIPDANIERTFAVNTLAHFWTVKAFLPAMLRRGGDGHIVTLASVAGLIGSARLTDYSASKFAAVGFHEALRAELRAMGGAGARVGVSLVCPAHIATKLFDGFKQPFVPSLTAREVADAMVNAVRERRAMTVLPAMVRPTLVAKALLPTAVIESINSLVGLDNTMSRFNGGHAQQTLAQMARAGANGSVVGKSGALALPPAPGVAAAPVRSRL